MAIAVVGMLDEREEALRLMKDQIELRGHKTLMIDISIGTGAIVPSLEADVSCRELAQLGGGPAEGVSAMLMGQRERAISIMAAGLTKKIAAVHAVGDLQGILAISGMTGALIALPAMKDLPFGVPKLIISSAVAMPIHADLFAKYFAVKDITVMHAVVDTVGMNALVQTLALNGANAISGMVETGRVAPLKKKPLIAMTEFGFCDKGAHYLRELLGEDFEIVSFHATGLGDQAAMEIVPQGMFKGFIDLVPGAFSEHLLGGNRGISGPGRLDIASKIPIPYIFCPGGFDIISCGPIERKDKADPLWTSRKLAERKLYIQESPRVQARLSAEEMSFIATAAAQRLNEYSHKKRIKIVIPRRGFSSLSAEGCPLYDPDSDRAFGTAIKKNIDPAIDVIEVDAEINSREYAAAVVHALSEAREEDSEVDGFMTKIEFVDQTIRDAQQSLWGLMMRTDHIIPIAEMMDKVGYRSIATVGSQAFTIQVRNHNEDPWERIRTLSKLMPRTGLRGSYQTASLSSFDLSTPRNIISLWIKRSIANGIKSFWICDYQENVERFRYFAQIAKAEGAEVVTALMYTSSPAHTDDHWAQKSRLIASTKDCVDRIMIEDASGILTPERTRELISTVQRNCAGIPLEFHSHCNSGLAPLCYLEAIQAGVTTVHTAVAPLANGTSLPSAESILKNARRLGFTSDLDEDALAAVSSHFRKIAEKENLPIGVPREYDLYHFDHQVPGGMMTNLTRQLRELGMAHRLDEILREVVQVRKEFGYPVMATPYSQIVGVQAVENVVSGERYKKIPDETIKYALQLYGPPVVPVDSDVMDRIMGLPRTKEFLNWKPEGYLKSIEELRQEIGPELSDDDLLLKILIPGKPIRKADTGKQAPVASVLPPAHAASLPSEFSVVVDGEIFSVKILPRQNEIEAIVETKKQEPAKLLEGAVICDMAGLVLSLEVKAGDVVRQGDPLAVIEAMKMRRPVHAPRSGVVREILAREGEIIDAGSVLMVIV